jgi:hypothetical protein
MLESVVTRTLSWALDVRGEVKAILDIAAQLYVEFQKPSNPVKGPQAKISQINKKSQPFICITSLQET